MPASFDLKKLGIDRSWSSNYDLMGEAYWGRIPNGTPVNTTEAARVAQQTFLQGKDIGMLPLMPAIPDSIIQKAIFGVGNGMGDHLMPPEEYAKATQGLRDELTKIHTDSNEEIRKAMTMGTSGSTGSNLMHVIADEGVTYLYKRPYPIQALIPTEANKGRQALWDVVGPYEFGQAVFGTEDQAFTETDITTHNRSAFIKFLYSVGRITKAAQFAGLAQVPARDMIAIRIDAAQDALRALRERRMLGVTSDVTSTTNLYQAASTNEYQGLYELITTNTSSGATPQNWVTSGGATYDQIMADLDESYRNMVKMAMEPNLAICDYRTFGIIRRGLMEYFRTEPIKEFVQGVSKIQLVFPNSGGLPLVPHPFLPMGATYGSIFLLDTRLIARRTLWQDLYEELAKINLSQKFVISAAETLIDKSDIGNDASGGGIPAYSLHGGVFSIA
jgi:hypothetical protein